MILLINTFLTEIKDNSGFGTFYDTGLYPRYSNTEIFKYSLLSLSTIKWKKVFINYDLQFQSQKKFRELNNFIYKNFDNPVIENFQIKSSEDWKKKFSKIKNDENEIFLSCDHDHIMINYNKTYLNSILNILRHDNMSAIEYSHWQPSLRYYSNQEFKRFYKLKKETKLSFTLKTKEPENRIIAKLSLLKKFLLNKDGLIRRPDEALRTNNFYYSKIIPKFEMSRHFHGYSHIGIPINDVNPLFIPGGIFNKKKIKIYYSNFKRESKNEIYINPSAKFNSSVDLGGTDWDGLIEDIPTFWKKKKLVIKKKIENENNLNLIRDLKVFKILKKYLKISNAKIFKKFEINFVNINKIQNYVKNRKIKINDNYLVVKKNLKKKPLIKILILLDYEPIIKKINNLIIFNSKNVIVSIQINTKIDDIVYEKIKFDEINNIDELIFYKKTPYVNNVKRNIDFDFKNIKKINFCIRIILINFACLVLRLI